MIRYLRTAAISLLVLLCSVGARYAAQEQTPGVIRINVNLVQVDAVVTDSAGKAVTDLKAEDFEIFQDGQPQRLTHFEFVNVLESARAPVNIGVSAQPRSGPDAVAPPPDRKVLKREEIRRTLAFVIDDLALSFDSTVRVRDSLKKWVDTEMRPGDLVAVIRTSAGMGSLQRFTMDKQGLHAAIDLLRYQPGRVGVSSFAAATGAPMEGLPDRTVFEDELEHTYLVGSLGAIQYVVRGLRELPGRKSLVLFSESMRFTFLQGSGIRTTSLTNATSEARLRRLADEASRSSVVIHAVDPRGVVFNGLTAEDNLNGFVTPITATNEAGEEEIIGFDSSRIRDLVANRDQQLIESRDGMIVLTQKTGGLFVKNNNDMDASVRAAVDDGNGYYLLGYQPELSTFDESGKPVFHSIRVRVKRPGLTVRSRSGFYGNADSDISALSQTPREQLVKALVSPFAAGDVDVRLTALFAPSDTAASGISMLLHIDADDLTFAEEPDGSRTSQVDVVAVTFNGEGEQIDTLARSWKVSAPQRDFQTMSTTGLIYRTVLPVKKAGPYQLRVVVRDTASRRLGSAMQYIDVPDLKKGRLTLSGIVMAGDPPATPAPEAGISREQVDSTPARRIFRTGSAVLFAYEILNARMDSEKKPQLEARVRVFRDGQQIYAGPSSTIETGSATNSNRVAAGGRLQLTQLTPGDYVLQVIVADNQRFDKYRIATQAIDFQVQSKP
jgi:VWFA-related protein